MKEYEIWSEGYRASGDSGTAHLHAKIYASSFEDAILKHAIQNEAFYKYLSLGSNKNSKLDGTYYTYWGCRIFDNESEARKSFG